MQPTCGIMPPCFAGAGFIYAHPTSMSLALCLSLSLSLSWLRLQARPPLSLVHSSRRILIWPPYKTLRVKCKRIPTNCRRPAPSTLCPSFGSSLDFRGVHELESPGQVGVNCRHLLHTYRALALVWGELRSQKENEKTEIVVRVCIEFGKPGGF